MVEEGTKTKSDVQKDEETKDDIGACLEMEDVERLVRKWRAETEIPDPNWFVWRLERYCEFCKAVGKILMRRLWRGRG
jgi:hypothetical protein